MSFLLKNISRAVSSCLTGAGQVMFQQSALSGLLFLAGIFYGSYECGTPAVAWGAVIALAVSVLAGYIAGYDREDGRCGLWGFNGILVGCALPTFYAPEPPMWAALVFFAMLTPLLRHGMNRLLSGAGINSLTFPFVLLTWIFILSARCFDAFTPASAAAVPVYVSGFDAATLVVSWLKGISQVFLIDSWVAGAIFLAGLAVCSVRAALWAAASSALALALGICLGANPAALQAGLYGFSPVLTGIAIGSVFGAPGLRTLLWGVLAVIATVFVQAALESFFAPLAIPVLTGPFCVTAWIFILAEKQSKQ